MSKQKFLALSPDAKLPQSARVQFLQKLKIAVSSGYWQPAEALPDSLEFANLLGIDQADVKAAYEELIASHWLQRSGENLHITPKIDQPVSCVASLSDMLKARGYSPGSIWLNRELCSANMDEQCRLHLPTGAQVARLERLRTANDEVIGYEVSSLPASLVPEPDNIGNSLYAYMNDNNLDIARAVEEISADLTDRAMSERTGFKEMTPLLVLTRVSYMANGRALELTWSYFRADYYRYVVELND